ncbi:MAG: VCBS repeat-containing protein [Opitutales bacterium]|nr:VCBS repeat-containing protein [Opitutales bacterium]
MTHYLSRLVVIASFTLCALPSHGQAQRVYLSSPEVIKTDWNTRALSCADVDGDGFTDIVIINNDSGKIEIFYHNNPDSPRQEHRRSIKRNRWEPVLEDAEFWNDSVMMGMSGYDLSLGDLNGDGKTDIAFSGNLTSVNVFYQNDDNGWDEWSFNNSSPQQWAGTIVVEDIDRDGRDDLAQISTEELLFFYQDTDGKLGEPHRYKISASDAHRLVFEDINADGLPDALFMCGNDRLRRLSVRIQQQAGVFGPEIGFSMPNGSIGLKMIGKDDSSRPVFATIDGRTRMINSFVLVQGESSPCNLEGLQMQDYTLGCTAKARDLYTYGDYNGDGLTDIVVADAGGARVILFKQNGNGDFDEGKSYPSLSKINSISTLTNENGPDKIVVASSNEKVVGIVSHTKKGRLGFPAPLPTEGEPIAVTSGHFDSSGNTSVAVLEKREKDYFVSVLISDNAEHWESHKSFKLPDVKRAPSGLYAIHVNKDSIDDLLVFANNEAARIFISTEEGFEEVAANSPVRISGMNNIDASRITMQDVDKDGQDELVVASNGYLRALRITEDGQIEIVDQYNSINPKADIKGTIFKSLSNNTENNQIVFFDDESDRLELLSRDGEDGVMRSKATLKSDYMNGLMDMRLINMGTSDKESILVLGQERFGIVSLDRPGWKSEPFIPSYESDLADVHYTGIGSGDLNGDSIPEVVALDGRENLLDVLERSNGESFQSTMHFVVFESNPHANTRGSTIEPRECLVQDLNNDGLEDVILMVHDRILIYSSLKEEARAASR